MSRQERPLSSRELLNRIGLNEDCYRSPTAIDFAMVHRQFYLYHPNYFKHVVIAECRKVYNRPDSQAKREAEMSR